MSAQILAFPSREPRPRSCFDCDHLGTTAAGQSHCLLFDEPIDSEIQAAKDCHGFEERTD